MEADAAAMLARAGRSRETKIRRDRLGRWFNDGVPITHPQLVRAFNTWLQRAEDGRFCLSNAINWAYVGIEGAAYTVTRLEVGPSVVLTLSNGDTETLDPHTLQQDDGGALYCEVRSGAGAYRNLARFDRHAVQQLASLVDEDDEGPFLSLGERVYRPRLVAAPVNSQRRAQETSDR